MENSINNTEETDTMTMQDAVDQMQFDEEQSIAVFGAGNENDCSYSLGYVNRQAVFACRSCDPLLSSNYGICYGCSLHCHKNHDLLELYTKRDFRCDCGNSKVKDVTCLLEKEKDPLNVENKYNHNFSGLYCTCKRPYPDPDDDIEDEMIQCIICEDWFHGRHLGSLPPSSFSEMACDACVKKHVFLLGYKNLTAGGVVNISTADTNNFVDVTSYEQEKDGSEKAGGETNCKLSGHVPPENIDDVKAIYWREKWRDELCKCVGCKDMYKAEGVSFLLVPADTILVYEEKGKAKAERIVETAADEISRLNHVQQVELMQGYNELKENLHGFFSQFRDQNKVIRKEDVENFFEELNEKKKRRRLDGQPPDYCR